MRKNTVKAKLMSDFKAVMKAYGFDKFKLRVSDALEKAEADDKTAKIATAVAKAKAEPAPAPRRWF